MTRSQQQAAARMRGGVHDGACPRHDAARRQHARFDGGAPGGLQTIGSQPQEGDLTLAQGNIMQLTEMLLDEVWP